MPTTRRTIVLAGILAGFAAASRALPGTETLVQRDWLARGAMGSALIHFPPPSATGLAPVLFVFHGEDTTIPKTADTAGFHEPMTKAARTWAFHELWPEAIVVYPQSMWLPAPGDAGSLIPHWEESPGGADYDLGLFDAILASLIKESHADSRRVYAMGYSNGGSFTYVLWAQRGDLLAAVAPCAAITSSLLPALKPKPFFAVAGENDQTLKFSWQKGVIGTLLRRNECDATQPLKPRVVTHPSRIGAPVMTLIHGGGHELPPEVPAMIVAFFKAQARP